MEYQCNKLTVVPYSDEVKSAHTEMKLSQKQMASSKILLPTEVQMSSVGDGEINTEQLTVCESIVAAMGA